MRREIYEKIIEGLNENQEEVIQHPRQSEMFFILLKGIGDPNHHVVHSMLERLAT